MLYLMILVIGGIGSVVGPWWALPLVAFVACAFKAKTPLEAFITSSSAGITLWLGYSLILAFSGKENLVNKIGALFAGDSVIISSIPSLGLILGIVTIVATLTSGFAGIAGKHLSILFRGISI